MRRKCTNLRRWSKVGKRRWRYQFGGRNDVFLVDSLKAIWYGPRNWMFALRLLNKIVRSLFAALFLKKKKKKDRILFFTLQPWESEEIFSQQRLWLQNDYTLLLWCNMEVWGRALFFLFILFICRFLYVSADDNASSPQGELVKSLSLHVQCSQKFSVFPLPITFVIR